MIEGFEKFNCVDKKEIGVVNTVFKTSKKENTTSEKNKQQKF